MSPNQLENYYQVHLHHRASPEDCAELLNSADVARKFSDEEREHLMVLWMTQHGYVEVQEADLPAAVEAVQVALADPAVGTVKPAEQAPKDVNKSKK
jgi:hypothetical protein